MVPATKKHLSLKYLLDWSNQDKCYLFAWLIVFLQLFFWLMLVLVANFSEFSQAYFSSSGLTLAHKLFAAGIALSSIFVIWGWVLRRQQNESKRYVRAFLYFFGIPFILIGHLIGHFHPLLGVMLLGSGLTGTILFGLKRVIGPFLLILSIMAALTIANIYGVIEHAPLLSDYPITKHQVSGFWTLIIFIASLPFAVGAFVITQLLLSRWHEREENVRQLSLTDELTRLPNRRAVLKQGENELKRALRKNAPFSLAILDIDHFKKVNDTWGHEAGDEVLIELGQVLSTSLRGADMIGRFGGEEFVVLLPDTDTQAAVHAVERFRQTIESHAFTITPQQTINITVSFGVCLVNQVKESTNLIDMLRQADKALYLAKSSGRNRVESATLNQN